MNPKNVSDPTVFRRKAGIPDRLGSCHTAIVQGYAIEGHVPAREIKRLLAQKPKARGLAVMGMPAGSPGMTQTPHRDAFDVVLVLPDGTERLYARYNHDGTSQTY